MDRSELIRYANDTLLDEFKQRLGIQIRYIETQMAMLRKELMNLEQELKHLNTFFPKKQATTEMPQAPKLETNSGSKYAEDPIPKFLQQDMQTK